MSTDERILGALRGGAEYPAALGRMLRLDARQVVSALVRLREGGLVELTGDGRYKRREDSQ